MSFDDDKVRTEIGRVFQVDNQWIVEDPHEQIKKVMSKPVGSFNLSLGDDLIIGINLPMRVLKRDPQARLIFKMQLEGGYSREHFSFMVNSNFVSSEEPDGVMPSFEFVTPLSAYDMSGGENLIRVHVKRDYHRAL